MSGFFDWENPAEGDFPDSPTHSWKGAEPGDGVEGDIVSVNEVEQKKFDEKTKKPTNEVATFKNGTPKKQLAVSLKVDEPTEQDSGLRTIWIRRPSHLFSVIGEATGGQDLEVGGHLRVEVEKYGDGPNGLQRFFKAVYAPPENSPEPTSEPSGYPEGLPPEAIAALEELKKKQAA